MVGHDGPVGYWRLSETTGTTATDSAGANDGKYLGGYTLGFSGALTGDTGVHLNGTSGTYVIVANVFSFAGNLPFSVELWAYPDAIDMYRRLVSKEAASTGYNQGWALWLTTTGLVFVRKRDTAQQELIYPAGLPTGKWSYVVATYDGTAMHLFIDGTERYGSRDGANVQMLDTLPELAFGQARIGTGPFHGALDEIAIYDRALMASEVAAHYAASGH